MSSFAPTSPAGFLSVALSNYMKSFTNNALVGDMIAPRVPVALQSFQYVIFDRASQRLDRAVVRAPGSIPQADRMSYSVAPYSCVSHALRAVVPYEQEQYSLALGFSEKKAAVRQLMAKLSLSREQFIANLVTTPSNLTNVIALAGTAMFDSYLANAANVSQPIQVVESAKAIARQAGIQDSDLLLIIGDPVAVALQSNPTIIERFKYTNVSGIISMDQLSSVFGVKCVRASAIALNNYDVPSWVWGTNMVLTYSQQASSMYDLSALKTFEWTSAPETAGGYGVLEFPAPDLDRKADIVSADWYWDTRITAQETIVLISNCCAAPQMGAIAQAPVGY